MDLTAKMPKVIQAKMRSKFPHLYENLRNGNVFAYDGQGFTRELTEDHKQRIAELEKNGTKIIAVQEGTYDMGFGDILHMTSFITMPTADDLCLCGQGTEQEGYEIVAFTMSEATYGGYDGGSIGIVERAGCLFRTW